jgi:hypothetical protein|tara:strand:- start:107 stop:481 length:375 start_codon:yes stop_codon:yes gene_type:complete
MAAGNYSFTIEQGTTFERIFKYKDENGSPVDLTGYDVRMQIRSTYGSDILASLTSGSGDFVISVPVDAAEGVTDKNQIKLTISASHTAAYTFDQALYDIELESGTGVVTRLLQGKIKLSREVTK